MVKLRAENPELEEDDLQIKLSEEVKRREEERRRQQGGYPAPAYPAYPVQPQYAPLPPAGGNPGRPMLFYNHYPMPAVQAGPIQQPAVQPMPVPYVPQNPGPGIPIGPYNGPLNPNPAHAPQLYPGRRRERMNHLTREQLTERRAARRASRAP